MIYLLLLILWTAALLYEGLIIWNFWFWFLIPLGASEIAFMHATGLACFIGMLTATNGPKTPAQQAAADDPGAHLYGMLEYVLGLTLFFAFGAVIHLAM